MVRGKWVDGLKNVEGTRVCGHVSQPVPMCCRRRGDTKTYLVFQVKIISSRSCNAALCSFADWCRHGRSCTAFAKGPDLQWNSAYRCTLSACSPSSEE